MKRSVLATIAIIIFSSVQLFAQSFDETIAIYAKSYNQEKGYIHYDKSTYVPGETIWFKAYLMSGVTPAEESKNFYIDWTDEQGTLLAHNVHPLVNGSTNGQFTIPAEFKGNFIRAKGYTKWMLNFDSAFHYQKDIRVLSKQPLSAAKPVIIPSLQFFPEGGDAVAGVINKIAFKANDQWGRPIKIKGIVQDSKGIMVDSLRVAHDGMGFFFLTPGKGEAFVAKWKDEKGVSHTTPLPAIRATGISLQVASSLDKKHISINTPSPAKLTILGTMNQHQVFKVEKDITTGNARLLIPTKDLPTGILTITVFDQQWKPVAERISFINNEEFRFTPELNVLHWGLSKRARNEIELTVSDSVFANLSIAVTDVDIDTDSSNNIVSHLLLTSEIKGRVHNPSYYFSGTNDIITQHLDLVMLTNGWRRFNWEDIAAKKFPKINFPRDTSYLTLSGRIYGVAPGLLRDAGDIILFLKPKVGDGTTIWVPIKPDGGFEDPSMVLFDSVHIYYQLEKKKNLGDPAVQFLANLLPPFKFNMPASGYFNNFAADTAGRARNLNLGEETSRMLQYEGKVLGNVTVTAKTKSPLEILNEKYTSGLFRFNDGYQFDLVNDFRAISSTTIFQYLQGKVPGMMIDENGPSVLWRQTPVQFFIDEMQAQLDMVRNIPVTDVAYIKVLRPPFYGGGGGGSGGAVAIYTKRGDDRKGEAGKGLSNNVVRGYTEIKQFYSPNYSSFKPENDKKDIRTTIYWNPQVRITPGENKVKLSFYNNDVSRAFRVIVEGMSQGGRLTHFETILE